MRPTNLTRRAVLRGAAAATATSLLPASRTPAQEPATRANRLGLYINLTGPPDAALRQAAELGFDLCEIYTEDLSDAAGAALVAASEKHHVHINSIFTMGPGPEAWDFVDGPSLNGLASPEHRAARVARLKQAAEFTARFHIPAVETHVGFLPENPRDPLYKEMVAALKEAVGACRQHGRLFLYHAGCETPITLVRTIRDVGLDNQGIGLDTANPILYGKGHPADAIEAYGPHLRTVNAKDGRWPTDPDKLGSETPISQGQVDFPRVVRALRAARFAGPVLIERETSGPGWVADIKASKVYLEDLLKTAG